MDEVYLKLDLDDYWPLWSYLLASEVEGLQVYNCPFSLFYYYLNK